MRITSALLSIGGMSVIVAGLIALSFGLSNESVDAPSYIVVSTISALVVFAAIVLSSSKIGAKPDTFTPLYGLLFVVLLGATLRAPYMVTQVSTSENAEYLLFGYSLSKAEPYVWWYFVGILSFIIGYLCMPLRAPIERLKIFNTNSVNHRKLEFVCIIFLAIAIFGIISFLKVHNLSLSGGLFASSGKKALEFESGGQVVYGAGWQTFVGAMSGYSFILISALWMLNMIRRSVLIFLILLSSGVAAIIVPIVANVRSDLVILGFTILVVLYYFGKLNVRIVLFWLLASSVLVVVLTQARMEDTGAKSRDSFAEIVLGSGNGLDSYRTGLIISVVPEEESFQYGKTYLGLFSLAIPRALWPDKPNPAIGPWVKERIFHREVRNNGWPPGIIAEGYINFGFIGVVLAPFGYGMFLRYLYRSFKPLLGKSVLATVLHAASLYPLYFTGLSNNVALGMVAGVYATVPILILAAFSWKRPRPQSRFANVLPEFSTDSEDLKSEVVLDDLRRS